jgi:hypothetical protein
MAACPRRALLLPLLVLALAACGGGGGGLTKAQYDAKVSRLCLLAADRLRELQLGNSIGAWRQSGSTVVRVAEHFDKSLAALKAPSDLAAGAAVYLRANEKLATDYKAAVAAANAGDRAKLRAVGVRATADGAATFPAAKAIGATGCYIS